MLFRTPRFHDALQRALRAAIASHRSAVLCELLAVHGQRACALALADLSTRVIADALSMLSVTERAGVLRHLPRDARARLAAAGGIVHDTAHAPAVMPRLSPFSLLVGRPQA
ncbi:MULTISPECIES: hypothetical protein [unclassified Variovorax]|uniref:hypothetical protein n=1 Tax=unclassified Variovorax TaxID=663243 RepID=UPI002576043F|nr:MULTISPECIES: hypothetical protein [unclassified Variovorax]MDM0087426.1 hypothetical protein [Variovorax sp. J22G40]MDM0144317.1 hypothetical protein [Variovorax sp. J2P1-31]